MLGERLLVEQGRERGKDSSCLFKLAATGSMAFIYGVDFVVSGPESHLVELRKAITQKHKATVRATL